MKLCRASSAGGARARQGHDHSLDAVHGGDVEIDRRGSGGLGVLLQRIGVVSENQAPSRGATSRARGK